MVIKEYKLNASEKRNLGRAWVANHPFSGVEEDHCVLCTLVLLDEQARQEDIEQQ